MSGFCIHCGSPLPPHALFCDACGRAILPSEQTEKSAPPHLERDAQLREKISKPGPLLAGAAIVALLIVIVLGALLWPLGNNSGHAAAVKPEADKALTTIMGRWGSTPDSTVALFEFRPDTMTTSGHTFPVQYTRIGESISVEAGDPPRELARLVVVTPKEIRLEGAATVTLYRVR